MQVRRIAIAFALALVLASTAGARADSRYVGVYTTTRPGAESTQALTLVLDRSGRATLTTSYPDLEGRYGHGILPIQEQGTWRDRGATVLVRFTRVGMLRDRTIPQPVTDTNVIAFVLHRCRLTAVQYAQRLYGEAGLTFEKSGCRS
jgi:hypothetical protein